MTSSHSILASKLSRLRAQLPYVPETLALVFRAAPRYTVFWFALLIAQGLLPIAVVYLGRTVVNALTFAIRAGLGWQQAAPVLIPLGLLAVALLATEALRGLAAWVRTAQSELLSDHIHRLIQEKSVAVDLGFYESADFYDHLHRARDEATYRPQGLLDSVGGILQNGLTLACMLAILIPFGPWIPVALILATLPSVLVVIRYAVEQHRWRVRNTANERRSEYYDWLLTAAESAPEVRLFGLGRHFMGLYQDLRTRARGERIALARKQLAADLAASASAIVVTGLAVLWIVRRVLLGSLGLGDLALFYGAFQQGLYLGRTLLENVGQVYFNSLFLGNLFEFLNLRPGIVSPENAAPPPARLQTGIEFRNVSFRYSNSSRLSLDALSLTIPADRITAIVGCNGSGKSTLLKLLCRFYDPESGSILLDGLDLRTLPVEQLRQSITVLFQAPVQYNTSAHDNIALGDLPSAPARAAVEAAARRSGVHDRVQRLPSGYDTLLGRQFETGTDLSGGEWQRLALARAFLRLTPILILDEPTSAMDPWAEAEWLAKFRTLAVDRTAVVITHRFTTAMAADLIYVLDEGRVLEHGSHAGLLAQNGAYARGWTAQMIRD